MSPAEDPMAAAESSRRASVLLVEDEVLLRLALAEELRALGFVAIEAANGEEARSLILAGVGVDLVMSDLTMPGELDGVGFATWLAQYGSTAPVILTSGLPTALARARAECPHVRAFVPKPYDQGAVIRQIEALLSAAER